jgi:hypothetical protein
MLAGVSTYTYVLKRLKATIGGAPPIRSEDLTLLTWPRRTDVEVVEVCGVVAIRARFGRRRAII